MPVIEKLPSGKQKKNVDARAALLIIQILLPFGLYFSLRWANQAPAMVIAALFVLSMVFVTWLG
jgi:hypothetical protein